MQNIIGVGSAGVNIAMSFSQYPQYVVYTVDSEESGAPRHYQMPTYETHEEYERKTPKMRDFFKDIDAGEDTLYVVGGGGAISGASLAILEQLKHTKIRLLYIRPDTSLLSETGCLRERVVFNVFQEYARSGKFEEIILVDNVGLDDIVGGAPVLGYFNKLNEILVSSIHMINVLDHTDAVMSTGSKPREISRIVTIGVIDVEEKEEKLFFPLTNVREKSYYYAINNEVLKTDESLYKQITEQIKEKSAGDDIKISYGIYPSEYKQNYGYLIARSSFIQSVNHKEE